VLEDILKPASFIKLSEHIVGNGEAFLQTDREVSFGRHDRQACRQPIRAETKPGLAEGQTIQRSEVVIGGYTEPRGSREYFGALVVGLYRGHDLHYVAHVGGGFNQRSLAEIYKLMQPLKTKASPFVDVPKTKRTGPWLKPKLVAEVKFSEWTADYRLRHPVFIGLREDKKPEDCKFEFERDTDKVVRKDGRKR